MSDDVGNIKKNARHSDYSIGVCNLLHEDPFIQLHKAISPFDFNITRYIKIRACECELFRVGKTLPCVREYTERNRRRI